MCPKWVPDTLATLYIQHTLEEAFFGILLATYLGWRTALFCTRTYNRILRPGLAKIVPIEVLDDSKLRQGFDQIDQVIHRWIEKRKVPA